MTGKRRNYLKECRELARFTQVKAASLLHISVRRLVDYEQGCAVPLGIIANMAKVYRTPMLAVWYVKNHTEVGEFLPDVYDVNTEGDMFMQSVMAMDKMQDAVEGIKALIIDDGKITPDEIPPLIKHVEQCEEAIANATSVVCFAKQIIVKYAA